MSSLEIKIATTEEDFVNCSCEIVARNPTILGFDTETALSHQNTTVSLIQIYDGQVCYLFRLSHVKNLPSAFLKILGRGYIKVGFDIEMDAYKLKEYNNVLVQGLIDTQHILRSLNYPFTSMKDTVTHFFEGYEMGKGVNHQSWNDDLLSEVAIKYAAYDAYLSYECYIRIMQMDRPQFKPTSELDFLEDREDVLRTMRKTQTVQNIKLKSLMNYIVNSYSNWRNRYPEPIRRSNAQAVLEKLAEEGQIIIDHDTVYLDPGAASKILSMPIPSQTPSSYSVTRPAHVNLDKQDQDALIFLRERVVVPNIKMKSLVNILSNGFGPWKGQNPNDKFMWASQTVQRLAENGQILQNVDSSYNIFS